jgi:hypothetical protein
MSDFRRIAALHRLLVLSFYGLGACFVAPSHRLPRRLKAAPNVIQNIPVAVWRLNVPT